VIRRFNDLTIQWFNDLAFRIMHIENLLFILLIAVAFLFQLLARAASKARKDQTRRTQAPTPRTTPRIRRAPTESDEERIRKLLEALGQPATSRPPLPVAPQTDIPPRPLTPVQPPVAPFAPLWKVSREERRKREVILTESPPSEGARPVEKIIPPPITDAAAFEVQEGPLPLEPQPIIETPTEAYAAATRPVAKGKESKRDIAILLASTSGLRNAIILREIFGPPRSLQPLDLVGSVWASWRAL
jgi:hypothetical protein